MRLRKEWQNSHFDPRWLYASIPAEHWHFHRQLLRRYRIVLVPGDFSAMIIAIRDGRARFTEQRAKGQAVYSVRVPSTGDRVYVLAAGARRVITVLPPTKGLKGKWRSLAWHSHNHRS
jgi:hypothetical protein